MGSDEFVLTAQGAAVAATVAATVLHMGDLTITALSICLIVPNCAVADFSTNQKPLFSDFLSGHIALTIYIFVHN